MVKAERLVLLTDVDGLFDADPKKNKKARLIPYKKTITRADLSMVAKNSLSSRGTGGMYSKLLAAQSASRSGIITHLLRGDHPLNLLQLAEGRAIGTQVGGTP
jgi:glutamate 5-kinase